MRRFVAFLIVLSAGLLATPAAQASDTVELIVRRDAGLTAAERAEVRADAGVAYERSVRLPDTEVVSVPAAAAAAALRELRADPDVRAVARNGAASPLAVAGADPEWGNLWGLDKMSVPAAWALTPAAGAGVTVAVVDSGAKPDHADLAGQFAPNGWDYVHGDATTVDNHGHGTHVTGTIVALNGNGVGVTGVAPGAKAMELQVFADDDGDGNTDANTGRWDWVIDAFDHAGSSGARVVNASLGGYDTTGTDDLANVLADTVSQYPNTLYVVAAGNDNRNLDPIGTRFLPCETPAPNVLCVGASTSSDARANFSNYGTTAVDVFAPGAQIESTTFDGSYGYMSGTSMATPNTVGIAALVFAEYPGMTGAQVRKRIIDTVDLEPGLPSVADGRVNAWWALAATDDVDADGVADGYDNCPTVANADQADADGDHVGDLCDGTPNGNTPAPPSADPPVTTTTPPTTPVAGRVTAIRTAVQSRSVMIQVIATQGAAVRLTAQRKVCRHAKCAWKTARTVSSPSGTIRLRLAPGRYRLRATAGTGPARYKQIVVRG
jgi:subtilisin family serine protease